MNKIRNIALVGAGKMSQGIATVCVRAGFNVAMVDLSEAILERALQGVKSNLAFMRSNGLITESDAQAAILKLKVSTDLEAMLTQADFVIESVSEDVDLKKTIFRHMDTFCPKHAILSTNTSSIRNSDLAQVTGRPHSVIGFHFVDPAYIIPVIEIIRGEHTSDDVINTSRLLATQLGKIPVVCREVPGFLINRLQMSLLAEAVALLEEGAASLEDIDNAMQFAVGIRYPFSGPFRANDLYGNKTTTLSVFEYLHRETGQEKFRPSELLREKVTRGELGLLTGKGWFDYSDQSVTATKQQRDERLVKMLQFLQAEGVLNTEI